MTDVFISYSRKDIAFARLLHQALIVNELEAWIDWQNNDGCTQPLDCSLD